MNEIERAIEELGELKKYAFILESPDSCFIKMNGMETELSLVLSAFSLAIVTDVVISALEKQIPKKPIRVSNNRTDGCPKCKTEYYEKFKYCPECGVKLDWSVEE